MPPSTSTEPWHTITGAEVIAAAMPFAFESRGFSPEPEVSTLLAPKTPTASARSATNHGSRRHAVFLGAGGGAGSRFSRGGAARGRETIGSLAVLMVRLQSSRQLSAICFQPG